MSRHADHRRSDRGRDVKATYPQLPTTLDELVAEAKACEAAGAALIHVHIRDGEPRPTLDLAGCATRWPRCASRPA